MKFVRETNRTVLLNPSDCRLEDTRYGLYGQWKHGKRTNRLYQVIKHDVSYFLVNTAGITAYPKFDSIELLVNALNKDIEFVIPENIADLTKLYEGESK